jgi:hypothetical protein
VYPSIAIGRSEDPARPRIPSHAKIGKTALASRHDSGNEGKWVKPAMAGIPAGAVQRMPQEGIPGLPPVDPADILAAGDGADAHAADNRS